MKSLPLYLLACTLCLTWPLCAQSGPSSSGKRAALVIGNAAYRSGPPLKNTLNDAHDMEDMLLGAGFSVTKVVDGELQSMTSALDEFSQRLVGADIALLYYSGHGIQAGGENYLMPVDAAIRSESELRYKAVAVGQVLALMEDSGARASIVILDACRDNPFASGWRSGTRGLSAMDSPTGSIIVYATKPGGVSADGEGRNGTWTGAFLRYAREPGMELTKALLRTRVDVMAQTNGQQVPWENSSLVEEIYLYSGSVGAGVGTAATGTGTKVQDIKLSTSVVDSYPANKSGNAPPGMVFIPAGNFFMGSPTGENRRENDETSHRVSVSSFFLAQRELSFDEYDAFCLAVSWQRPDDDGAGRGDRPVIHVSWLDAVEYCNWRSQQEGLRKAYTISPNAILCDWSSEGYRLPTEAEWEYACRAGTSTPFWNGASISVDQANWDGRQPYAGEPKGIFRGKTMPTGSFPPNSWGLYDMHGNVWEWCWDIYGPYGYTDERDPRGPTGDIEARRVYRGGSWSSFARLCRSARRNSFYPSYVYDNIGFRLARSR